MDKQDMRDAFFEPLISKAIHNSNIIFLTGDHSAFALKQFERECPERYYNIGIAEQNMISTAAGLALRGKKVYIYGITPFISIRTLEQLTVDVASMELPVSIIGAGAGFTYSTDGATHHGLQDTGALLTIPKLKILNCSDPSISETIAHASIESSKPEYIRIEKGEMEVIRSEERTEIEKGYRYIRKSEDVIIIGTGCTTQYAWEYIKKLDRGGKKNIGLIDMFAPSYENGLSLVNEIKGVKNIIVYDEGYRNGLCSIIGYSMAKAGHKGNFKEVCVESEFYFSGDNREGMKILSGVNIEILEEIIGEVDL